MEKVKGKRANIGY